MSTILQKYAPILLPFLILVVGGLQTAFPQDEPINWVNVLQFAILVVGAIGTYLVRLLPSGWQGALKTGIAIIATILAALVPFVVPGGFASDASWQLILVGVFQALTTELGVAIRTDPVNSQGVTPDPTSVPKGDHVAVTGDF